jgi:hypothetical protein
MAIEVFLMKRPPVTSTSSQIEIMRKAQRSLEPPSFVKLRPEHRPFWDAVIDARPRSEWDNLGLAQAARVAWLMGSVEVLRADLHAEGLVLTDGNGRDYLNPKDKLILDFERLIMAHLRFWQLGGQHLHGSSALAAKRRAMVHEIESAVDDEEDDDLIPRPGH